MQAIYALYPDPDGAQRAVEALRSLREVDQRQIVVISSEPFEGYDFFEPQHKTMMPWIAAIGGVVGGVLGFLFAAYTQAAYPIPTGGMPIVPLYADGIITYELTMLGAVLATLATLLITARLPNWRQQLYDPQVSDGKILVGAMNPPAASREMVEQKLLDAGADHVEAPGF